jgi:hypothetical protein
MRKSTLFLSAVLTAFVMAMLAGVASAYQGILTKTQAGASQAKAQTQPQTRSVADDIPVQALPVDFTPEQAAALAAQVLGHDDLYSVEVTDLNGETVFLVTFTSGDLVYVSLDGQIRSIGKVKVETVVVSSGGGGGNGGGGNGGGSQAPSSSQNHEEHEEHEEREEHEEHEEHEEDHD